MSDLPSSTFDFGENWTEFSRHALTPERVIEARSAFRQLVEGIPISQKTFLDVGFGQGLSLLSAQCMGGIAYGCDIDPKCADVLLRNRRFFSPLTDSTTITVGSILDERIIGRLRLEAPNGFEIVHSWGVLHHTGNMEQAIRNTAGLVAPNGHLILAIYNRHWSSSLWRLIKRIYVQSPRMLQRGLVAGFYPVILLAKLVVTRGNPLKMERGMDFYYDVVDWIGGYPYEFASTKEIAALVVPLGFEAVRMVAARMPTGCNEFIFRKTRTADR